MASNKGYTTATKVRAVIGSRVINDFTDAVIDQCINRIEGVLDTHMGVGSGTGALTVTWATAKPPHWVLEGAATYGAALQCLGPSLASWNTLDELNQMINLCTYQFKMYMDLITTEEPMQFIRDQ